MHIPNLPKSHSAQQRSAIRPAFTLIELLVVITVMVALGGMLTYALASAETDARIKRTQADVITIGQLLQSRVNEVSLSQLSLVYGDSGLELARQSLVSMQAIGGVGTGGLTTNAERTFFMTNERARLVLYARRDVARMVLPECQADLFYPPASLQFRTYHVTSNATGWLPNVAQVKPPSQWSRMRTMAGLLSAADIDANYTGTNSVGARNPATNPEYDAIAEAGVATFENLLKHDANQTYNAGSPTPTRWTRQFESSECLYLILATTELFGQTAIDKIPANRIEDTDGDGIPEILDAWGTPYVFFRNPIGFSNPGIKNYNPSGATPEKRFPFDPDPLDFLAADFRYNASNLPSVAGIPESAYFPIYLPPIVVSAGRDGEFGLRRSFIDTDGDGTADIGVNVGYSSSAVQFPANNFRPAYRGIPLAWCPDPFFNVLPVAPNSTNPYIFSTDGIVGAKRGGGLGAILDRETYADNITSLDSGI